MELAQKGRPKIDINWEHLNSLLEIQCTLKEVASFFGCSEDTIERRVKEVHGQTFAEFSSKKRAGGKISLRRKQFQVAMGGDVRMLIWLGKNWLGQRECSTNLFPHEPVAIKLAYNPND